MTSKLNPWLAIPAADYEGHMGQATVAQLQFLARIFKEALETCDSRTIAYLGAATGTGLQYIDNKRTERVTAFDINQEYLAVSEQRYAKQISNLQTQVIDLDCYEGEGTQYSLIFAGLIFEYVDDQHLLANIHRWLSANGTLVVVLQLPQPLQEKVSKTTYSSVLSLSQIIQLKTVNEFKTLATKTGLKEIKGAEVTLVNGKEFYVGYYQRQS